MNNKRLLARLLSGARNNVRYQDFVTLVEAFGFEYQRTVGSHAFYHHARINKVVNIQPLNGEAKGYQIGQFLTLVERHNLKLDTTDEN